MKFIMASDLKWTIMVFTLAQNVLESQIHPPFYLQPSLGGNFEEKLCF